mmetsp:Transcript_13753/g.40690  ORF Transcript_13753/g.40690 Transcript_13753/m.40690 type:complete len:303 (-) Transcript_13753:106-1014(-)|eukprot:CAMPEP_0118867470 /NCGR_PEP_ID=MMETSP1163-20130328/11063_1 /TAXON_ID=124430 /ORGANISM="Phaeomonas parva, Strain CCMP2877" /LENGTH=302 /DNA_ID=CAMNT_0006801887 /DNA_START=106 /DNA_END=1014 /DNA_ORIENTATION=-
MSVILVTAGYDHKIRFWDAPSRRCSRTLRFEGSQVNSLCISPDKRLLCATGNPSVHIWDIEGGNSPVVNFEGHTGNVTAAGFNKEVTWLYTGSEDGTIKIWDLRSPVAQRTYQSKGPVNTVTIHPNQAELISGDQGGAVNVWDLTAAELTSVLELVPDGEVAVRSVTIAADASKVVAGNNNADVFVWEPESSVEYVPQHRFNAHKGYLLKAVLSPDTKLLVTTSSDRTACVWSTETWQLQKTLAVHQRWVWDAAFSADSNYLVTASSDQSARLWDLKSGDVIKHYTGHNLAVTCVALNDASV